MRAAMRGVRQPAVVAVGVATIAAALVMVVPFLAPALSYRLGNRLTEIASGRSGRPFRIGLGVAAGSYYQVGTVLNRYLREKSGYELDLVATAGVPENVRALVRADQPIDLATIDSSSDEASRVTGISGLATLGRQYLFVIAPAGTTATEVRDLTGRVNPGVRAAGDAPTLGERVLEYYGLLQPSAVTLQAPVTVVRPQRGGILADFEAEHMTAATRTQFLQADLVQEVLANGQYGLVPIRDHEALARALPGTTADFIPAGVFGPTRRIPAGPVPTLSVATLLVARNDLPARVVSDILDVVYDPRFARDIRQLVTEDSGRKVGDLPLHPAAAYFYSRNDQVTSDRIGRISFVVSAIAAFATLVQFISRTREHDRRVARRRLAEGALKKLGAIRAKLTDADATTRRALLLEAAALLEDAEREATADRLDEAGIQSLRSLHATCWRINSLSQDQPVAPVAPVAPVVPRD
jgi:TRAP-type uncharacterized transport system substrate-binding protein